MATKTEGCDSTTTSSSSSSSSTSFSPPKKRRKKTGENDYKNYLGQVSRSSCRLLCVSCDKKTFASFYERHCAKEHGLNPKLCCVWCGGRYSWPKLTKTQHGDHLLACFKKFVSERKLELRLELCSSSRNGSPAASAAVLLPSPSPPPPPSSSSPQPPPPPPPADPPERRPRILSLACDSFATDDASEKDRENVHRPRFSSASFVFETEDFLRVLRDHYARSLFPEEQERRRQERAFRTAWPVDYVPPPVPFRNRSVNWAVCNTRQYLETRFTHDWFHVVVERGVAFDSFLSALDSERGNVKTLYFFRWCERRDAAAGGGGGGGGAKRHHRHMIVVCYPIGSFSLQVWSKVLQAVRPTGAKDRTFECSAREIVGPHDFVLCLGEVGRPNFKCDFYSPSSSTSGKEIETPELLYLNATLPRRYRLPLVLQWDGGVPVMLRELEEKVKKDTSKRIPRGLVLAVDKRYAPADRITDKHWCLGGGRKIYFERSFRNATLGEREWLERQAEGGNCFYDALLLPLQVVEKKKKEEEKKKKKAREGPPPPGDTDTDTDRDSNCNKDVSLLQNGLRGITISEEKKEKRNDRKILPPPLDRLH